ncbi:MAG TPA: asparagine synthase (glutamine-hydrolyzing) [Candidatus Acidoferrum sp.]|nr:asparagine synthase (glutamine-hydrolyzing) [Candidatus Acidoferrum sp.]
MCGIAGFWQSKRGPEHPLETLNRMGAALVHRGPDDSGTFHDGSTGIGLAFRRLSILDLSPEGHQPMFSCSGRYVIVFNGEVYNFQEIRAELGTRLWRGHSDTEVMLEAFERWGVDCAVRRFVGMFAFALWDRQERRLYLVRDRLGIKPLYYGGIGGDFVFASELKAIRQYPEFSPTIDRNSLALYMRHSYVPAPHSIYVGLQKLQPGCVLTLSEAGEAPVLQPFWSASDVARESLQSPFEGSDAEAVELLHQKLLEAVRLRMIADVPLGAFLSGGIDSSTVVALMQAQSNRPVKTFTIGFHEEGYNEARDARRVAEHLGTDHTELYLTPRDALDVVPLLPAMYDEPFADSSQIPTYLISKLARGAVTVSLSGDGGDELFGGYNRYLLNKRIWNSVGRLPKPFRTAIAGLIRAVPPATLDHALRLLRPLLPRSMRMSAQGDKAHKFAGLLSATSPEELYSRMLSHWQYPSKIVLNSHVANRIVASVASSAWLPSMEEVMMLTDLLDYLPGDILTKVDRASMAVSLEARVPLLDHRVVEFAWKLPLHFKIRNGTGKWILREVLYKYVPAERVERPKMGFGVPIDSWLRGPLRNWAEDLLSSTSLTQHGLLNPDIVREKWREHLSGAGNWQYSLWNVLVFQEWFFNAFLSSKDRIDCQPIRQ